ncbi:MAG: PAS domain-containing sensor histidine kinase, partial [Planctomycetota bacterium]
MNTPGRSTDAAARVLALIAAACGLVAFGVALSGTPRVQRDACLLANAGPALLLAGAALFLHTRRAVRRLVARTTHRLQIGEQRYRRAAGRARVRAQQAESHRRLLETIMDHVPEALIVADPAGNIAMVNREAAAFLGRPAEEICGLPLGEHMAVWHVRTPDGRAPEDSAALPLARALRGAVIRNEEWHLVGADGRTTPLLCNAGPTRDSAGQITGALLAWRDISERQRAEEERAFLLESERAARATAERANHAKDQFLAVLSHELRTPLNAILGWTQLILRGGLADANAREGLAAIEQSAREQKDLVDDLLDLGRISSGKLRLRLHTIDPLAVLDRALETVRPAAGTKGLRIDRNVVGSCPISGDPVRLQQVFWNILSNAVKFTERGGITITVRQP